MTPTPKFKVGQKVIHKFDMGCPFIISEVHIVNNLNVALSESKTILYKLGPFSDSPFVTQHDLITNYYFFDPEVT